ncbi:MAG TPA: hypothetical protein VNU68_22485 [Verrucomicrobiae bacterium]|nr:hypothetical protein [Verrucomicrobiae bacterium]
MLPKIEIDVENLLRWAYLDELSKRQTSSAEGTWDQINLIGRQGTEIDHGHGSAQRYCHFGLPDPDALLIEKAVAGLEDLVIDWEQSFDAIAAELSGLISVNDITKRGKQPRATKAGWGKAGAKAVKVFFGEEPRQAQDKPRDVLMVGGLCTGALVTMHAVRGTRPDWIEDSPKPERVPAASGPNAMVVGDCRGRNLYSIGSYCPLKWEPSPLSIVSSRAEYVAWHDGLTRIAETIQLAKFTPLPPKVSRTPWLEDDRENPGHSIKPVMPTPNNNVGAWGTLPLVPSRGRMGPPLRQQRAGPVRYLELGAKSCG